MIDEPAAHAEVEAALNGELARRLAELGDYRDDAFGPLGAVDALVIGTVFVALPLFVVWWFR
jgi:hypothetical protein